MCLSMCFGTEDVPEHIQVRIELPAIRVAEISLACLVPVREAANLPS